MFQGYLSNEISIETLVVYDQSMKDFHIDINLRSYINSLFDYVAYLYSDASIGNRIEIAMVGLVELNFEQSVRE